jgi:hypothetical protein
MASSEEEYDVGKDVSGFGLDGFNHGVIKKGKGDGFYFNGVDSYVQVSGEGHLKHVTDSQFSISLNVRPESIPSFSSWGAGLYPYGGASGVLSMDSLLHVNDAFRHIYLMLMELKSLHNLLK